MRARESSLLPVEDAREAALFFVVGALCFLAALAALTAKSTYGAARAWTAEVEGELTVTLPGLDPAGAARATLLISQTEGVTEARLFTRDEINALLEPSFGTRDLPESLPVPQLVGVTAAPGTAGLASRLSERLAAEGYDNAVDEHSAWAGDVRGMLGTARIAALSIVVLLTATAVAVIAFATHAALLARRDIVDVLHIAGARDRFIAGLFERRFWILGLRAGLSGSLVALAATGLVIAAARAGGGRSGLLPQFSLDFPDFVILIVTPVIAGLAARIAAHLTVIRALRAVM